MPDVHRRMLIGAFAPMMIVAVAVGCAAEDAGTEDAAEPEEGFNEEAGFNQDDNFGDNDLGGNDDNGDDGDVFEPEQEEFVVEQVAATDHYVFVPNHTEGSDTVALIDGRDFGVQPVRVGAGPERVAAAEVEGEGAVGYVLSSGEPVVSVVRADAGDGVDVRLLEVPAEVNDLALSPDGANLLAYIDPDEPIDDSATAASLQTMALVKPGDEPAADAVFELSVTPGIDDIVFTDDERTAFVSGEEGVHRLAFENIKTDMVVPALDLDVEGFDLDGPDREVAVSTDGTSLAIRTGDQEALALYEIDGEGEVLDRRVVELQGVPTDLEIVDDDDVEVVAPVRSEQHVVSFDFEEAMDAAGDEFIEVIDASGADVGIARWTPDESAMAVFSTIPERPRVGLVDIQSGEVDTFELRNQILNLEISPDGRTAVAVHRPQDGTVLGGGPEESFRHGEGLTLWDLESGFLRPVALDGHPEQIKMATDADGGAHLFVMLTPSEEGLGDAQGIQHIDLTTHATEFFELPRLPTRMGAVTDQIFVGQQQETGRITFFNIDDRQQRTVSGYELNAGVQ